VGLNGASGGQDGLKDWPLAAELQALAAGRWCHEAQRQQCQAASGAFAEWACSVCRECVRPEAVSPWTRHLLFLHRLQEAGYPFRANDLDLETWLLLGLVKQILTAAQRGRHARKQQ
jgi:hypothetical protein